MSRQSGVFQPDQQTITVAVFAKLVVVHAAVLLLHIALESTQQVIRGVIQQFSLGFGTSLRGRFHALNMTQRGLCFNF